MTEHLTERMETPMETPTPSAARPAPQGTAESRRHFLVDINSVFRVFGRPYFFIFYFGRHLHPRQQAQLVNQRTAGNWLVIALAGVLFVGFVYGVVQLVSWRLHNDADLPPGAGSFTQIQTPGLHTKT